MTSRLEASGLSKVYGPDPAQALALARGGVTPRDILARTGQMLAVADVSLSVAAGEIFTIMGLSGSGKSTLVRCLNRLIEPSEGSIRIDGEEIVGRSPAWLRQVRRRKIAMVFQNFALLPHRTVLQNVEFGLELRGDPLPGRRDRAMQAIERVGLGAWAGQRPDSLSGGMKQRVGLARALANDPEILLMDEPFSALDPLIRSDLQDALIALQRDIRKTIVFITHDFHEAVKLSDRVAIMRDGRFVQVGTPQDIVLRPAESYVANFARDLDKSRMLRVGEVDMAVPLLLSDASASEALEMLDRDGRSHAVLIDAMHAPAGYLTRHGLAGAVGDLRGRSAGEFRAGPVATVTASQPLPAVFSAFAGPGPVAVVDAGGRVVGALEAPDVLAQLGAIARQAQDGPAAAEVGR